MIIYTAKFSKKKAIAILLAIAVVIAAIILAVPEKEAFGAEAFGASAMKTSEDMTAYIASIGYTAENQPIQCREVTIPWEFDEVYSGYNDMQKECGFDLEDYKGKKATLYTYAITDYPGCDDEVLCDLLIYREKVIGGNIYTLALDGFMHGLKAN